MQSARVIAALGAIAHEHRLAAFRMLVERGPKGLPAGEIAERLKIPPSSLTFHIRQLLHAGLITQRRLGRQLIYAADFATMNGLIAYLTENCCGVGNDAACGPVCKPVALERRTVRRKSA